MNRLNLQQVFPFISSTLSVMLMMQPSSVAQLTPDNTLGAENSKITNIDQLRQKIDGGAIRGNNLFHSFLEFNVAENGSVYFSNPANIQNILSRVTGGNASHILGTLGVLGNANLFLINPNGVIFGDNAILDVQGSFFVTTSNSIQWGKNGFFSATQPEKSNLLSVSPDTLFFNHAANHQGSIINRGKLAVNGGENITFFGNTVVNSGSLIAPGGTIQLLGDRIGLLNNSLIDVSHSNHGGTVLIGGNFQGKGIVPNATYTYVGSDAIIKAHSTLHGDGGKVIIWADQSTHFYGKIEAQGGLVSGNGGFVEVSGKDFLDFRGTVNTSAPNGEIGTLLLDPTNIEVVEFFSPEAETFNLNDIDEFSDIDIGGDGDTKIDVFAINFSFSDVILQATNNITFNADINAFNSIDITAEAGNDIIVNNYIQIPNQGNINLIAGNNINLTNSNAYLWSYGKDVLLDAGNLVSIRGDSFSIAGGGNIDTRPFFGSSGNIKIKTHSLTLSDNAKLLTVPSGGFLSGDINIETIGDIEINPFSDIQGRNINIKSGNNIFMNGSIQLEENSNGILDIGTKNNLLMTDANGFIFTLGNDAFIDVGDTLLISEALSIADSSNIDTAPFNGDSGNLTINAKSVILSNGAQISTRPFAQGNGGVLTIEHADLVELRGQDTGLFTNSNFFNNASGEINLSTQHLTIKDSAEINTSTEGTGKAGTITINSERITLEGNNSQIFTGAESFALGNGGDINITTNLLEINDGAKLDSSSSSLFEQNSGDITINADNLLINNASVINAANLRNGNSGTIKLNLNDELSLKENSLISTGILNSNGQQGGDIRIIANTVVLEKQSGISTRTLGEASAGNIEIMGDFLSLSDDSTITTSTLGEGNTGIIKLDINEQISIVNDSGILSSIGEFATGNSQGIEVNTQSLILNDSILATATESDGNAGTININARDQIIVDNDSAMTSTAFEGNGNGGNININSSFVVLSNASSIDSATSGKGTGANITIEADYLTLSNLSGILTTTLNQGNAGHIILNINRQLDVNNSDITASSDIDKINNIIPTGEAGSIIIKTPIINLENNGNILAESSGLGNLGNIETINNQTLTLNNSSISTEITRTGEAKQPSNITLNTRQLTLNNNSEITASTAGKGDAGSISINAETVALNNNSNILTILEQQAMGTGGNINITTSGNSLTLNNRSQISSRSQGVGNAGNIFIDSSGSIRLIDSDISTASQQSSGGEIIILGSIIRFFGDSDIRTNVNSGIGGGGDIFLEANSIILYDDSDIFAFAQDGQGGNIFLNTPIFFGEGYQTIRNGRNTSILDDNNQVNLDASGAISGSIILPDLTFIRNSLTELPSNIINTEQLIANTCVVSNPNQTGTFIITGTGGLPEKPGNTARSYYSTGSIQTIPNQEDSSPVDSQIIEPQGVFKLPDGRLILSRRCSE